ncbi:T7SS effector LXG polymorphic toxin [Terribacillus saccharophilus]|uniref:T7SS effector LXG polymorphic toxin n=1 Tax=Terribacillus saccharophilus TaxID=361277 RepID=UPI003826D897
MKTIKNLDVQDIQQQVDSTKDFISKTKENVEQVKQALNGITTLHDGFSGNTADSIRSFYEEAHKPFLEFMESFLVQYEEALSSVSDQVLSFEPNESGFIRQEFLEGELTNKMQKAQDSLSATTDMINQQLNSVSDLASVSHVKDDAFLDSIADAKKRINKTVDIMYEMDSNATSKLDKSEDDMQQMKTYISKLRNAIDKNNITVDKFNITQFNSEFFSYHDEFKLMAKGRNALATGEKAEITAEEFNQLYPYIKNEKNVIDEYYEWNGTYHSLKDGRIIREYMHDTGVSYEFVDKIPEPRSKPLSDTEEIVYGAVGGVWNFFTEDLATVLDPEATKGEKAFALAMFLPVGKPVKIIDKGSGFVSDGIKSLDKIIESQSKKGMKVASSNSTDNIYKNYRPVEYNGTTKVNGEVRDISRRVFQRLDLDYKRIDLDTGMTNYQLMKKGRSPIWEDGTVIELHHLIQREPGSMVEIPASMHDEYNKILHGLVENGGSFRNDPVLKKQYDNFRSKYWRWRAKQIDKSEL